MSASLSFEQHGQAPGAVLSCRAMNVAYRLTTPDLVLRCIEPQDAPARKQAVDASGEHLEDFFRPTPEGPMTLDAHVVQLRRYRAAFDSDTDRCYAVLDAARQRFLGEALLLKRVGIDALELGYWIRADAAGRGLATQMASALVKCAFELEGVARLDLLCLTGNERSAAMARRLGFTLEGTLRDRQLYAHHRRGDLSSFSLLASEYPRTRSAGLALEAFDVLGRPLSRGGRTPAS